MIKIIHRVNDVQDLNKLSVNFGVEIDIRANNGALILSHDLNQKNSSNLNDYLDVYNHQFLVANIKESGIEEEVINALETKNISNYFLLDVEFPFLLQNFKKYGDILCLRYSYFEGIDTIKNFVGEIKWVWIDTYKDFELTNEIADILKNFNLCLVSPSRWGYKEKVSDYIEKFKRFDLSFKAIMIEENEHF
tara:strand:- start:222 stop:797 length:576 start_codon:yes stop_codon:yes gene_type:complete